MSQYIIDILKIENKSWIEDFYYTNDDKKQFNYFLHCTDDKIIWIIFGIFCRVKYQVEKSTIQLYEVTLLHKPI